MGDLKLYIERRENQFRDEDIERTRIVKPSELMKTIAATFLFQPHRAARDYRGIRSEYEKKIFLDDHNVEIYHTAAYANYKFEFLVRNKKIRRSWRIYKFFTLFALGDEATSGKDIFGIGKAQQKKACNSMLETLAKEDLLLAHVERCCTALDTLVEAAKLDTREKLRDYIRSETVIPLFKRELAS